MNFLPSQLIYFFQNKTTRKNLVLLARFICFILLIILLYSILFHLLMLYEGRDYSWVTGMYWTLTVMSTLGFGDITFHTDLGLLFTLLVLSSGIILLLILLPFTFIQFFYAPWLEAQSKIRTPRELPEDTKGHIIITNLDPITEKLVGKLNSRNYDYVLVVDELQRAVELYDEGYKVVVGSPDDPETYQRLRVENAALVVATKDDMINTSIAFTVRELTTDVPVVTSADHVNSLDILQYPGNMHIFQFANMLGRELGKRTFGLGRSVNIVSRFDDLHIAEIHATQTSLAGRNIFDLQVRSATGATIIGLWEQGRFEVPSAATTIGTRTLLLLAGTEKQIDAFEQRYALPQESISEKEAVVILGGGRVGLAAADVLDEYEIPYRVVDKKPRLTRNLGDRFVCGDAADIDVLEEAGVMAAKTVIITSHDDAVNIYLAFYCRQLRADIQIISRATHVRSVSKLHMAGADLVMSYASMGANRIINILKSDEITMFTEGLNVFSCIVPSGLVGKNLMQSSIRESTDCSVIALQTRSGLVVGPDPAVPFEKGDEIILIGVAEAEKRFLQLYKSLK
ncbi:MAG: potassium transporter TrkA [Deltaproteobacteria bacterium]|nr:MAG: potassium transporter TrkA [Desulfobacterales bacterium]PIE73088.1 MAG: potassium transporter TrkA [Deltaproteobacteria bacterium]